MRILFITWDGPQQVYLESLFSPIFSRLRSFDVEFDVLQLTWADRRRRARTRDLLAEMGIGYSSLPVMRSGGAGGVAGTLLGAVPYVKRLARERGSDVLMPRALFPAAIALGARRIGCGARLAFDADGLMADERVEFGGWSPSGMGYRFLRDVEAEAVRQAYAVTVRSADAVEVLRERAGPGIESDRFHVVPNPRDEHIFYPHSPVTRSETRQLLGVASEAPLVVYCGSVGPKYRVHDMLEFFKTVSARDSQARLLALTPEPNAFYAAARDGQVDPDTVIAFQAQPAEVPRYLAAADLGLTFLQPTFSLRATSAIKTGEYLLSGVPVLTNQGGASDQGRYMNVCDDTRICPDAIGFDQACDWLFTSVLPYRSEYRRKSRERGLVGYSLSQAVGRYHEALCG